MKITGFKHHLQAMSPFYRRQLFVDFLIFASAFKLADSAIVVSPKDAEAVVGTSVVFNCSSSITKSDVQWNIYSPGKNMQVIYAFRKVNAQYADRFTVQDGHNLYLSPVTVADAGTYECHEDYGQGERHSAELTVIVTNPICHSGSNLSKVVGNNTMGIDPSQVFLSCSVQFHGKNAPILEWMKTGEVNAITSGISHEIRGNLVIHNLTLKGDSIANGSSYNCRLTKTTSATTCNSGKITIIADCSSVSTCQCQSCIGCIAAIICICVTVCIGLASYVLFIKFWRKKKSGKQNDEQKILLNEKENKKIKDPEKEIAELMATVKDLESHLLPSENINYAAKPSLTHEIVTNEKTPIKGLAVLENTLFVLHENCSEIEVYIYDTNIWQPKTSLLIPKIQTPFDMTGWHYEKSDKCLCIVGVPMTTDTRTKNILAKRDSVGEESLITCIGLNGTQLTPWPVKSGCRKCHLSTHEASLIVLPFKDQWIKEFSRNGELIREVNLVDLKLMDRLHGIKVTSIHFAMSFKEPEYNDPTIIVIDFKANIIKKYTGDIGFLPYHFIFDGKSSYLVADKNNGCVSLLSTALNTCSQLITLENGAVEPERLCQDEKRSSLFVATKKTNENKSFSPVVQIYKIK